MFCLYCALLCFFYVHYHSYTQTLVYCLSWYLTAEWHEYVYYIIYQSVYIYLMYICVYAKVFLAKAKMVHRVILCKTADISATDLFTWKSLRAMLSTATKLHGGGEMCSAINCTNRQYKSLGKLFFHFPKNEARKAIDFWFSLTFKVRCIARTPFVFLLSLFAAIVSPDKFFFNYTSWSVSPSCPHYWQYSCARWAIFQGALAKNIFGICLHYICSQREII